jgi:hypothetical protein
MIPPSLQTAAKRFLLPPLLLLGAAEAAARPSLSPMPPKPAFYATSAACAAARIFSKVECDNAFSSAFAEIRTRRLAFSSRIDCMVQFHLCERQGHDGYAPVVLGVEIVKGRGGGLVTPVLAVPTPPGLLPQQPIAGPIESREDAADTEPLARRPILLPTDHFERVDVGDVREAWGRFRRLDEAVAPVSVADEPVRTRETPQQRRARLQEAPFIE